MGHVIVRDSFKIERGRHNRILYSGTPKMWTHLAWFDPLHYKSV